jgi:ABC-type transporter Mla subunit MlaD
MSDVKIAIGAQDTASKVLQQVGNSTKQLDGNVNKLAGGFKGLAVAMGPLVAVFAAFKAASAVLSTIGDSNEAFLIQEKAARGASDAQKDYANQMQRVLGVGDEVSLGLMKQAELLGISKGQTDEAVAAAVGLAKVTGQGLPEALKKVSQAMNGNASSFAEVIPGIAEMATEQEKLAAINALATRGLEEQKASMQGLEGIQTRANNSWGDMLEVIGSILAPIRAIISQGIAVFAETMQSALVPAVELASAAMQALPAIFEWVNSAIVGAITFIEVVIGNFPAIVQAAAMQAQLYWLQMSEAVKHTFTVVIPAYLAWFGDNWVNLLTDVFSAGLTITQNYIQNYADIILRLWDFVSSGFKGGAESLFADIGDIASRNLLEGFEARTQSLPEILSRQITSEEQRLQDQIGQIGESLGTEFSDKFIWDDISVSCGWVGDENPTSAFHF